MYTQKMKWKTKQTNIKCTEISKMPQLSIPGLDLEQKDFWKIWQRDTINQQTAAQKKRMIYPPKLAVLDR